MFQTTDAFFDGKSLLPDNQLNVEPNTRVRLTIEVLPVSNDSTAVDHKPPGNYHQAAQELIAELDQKYGKAEDKIDTSATKSFWQTAREMKLQGPKDMSVNLDQYIYGGNNGS